MIARRWITHYRSYLPFVASLVVLAVVWETVGQHTELLTLPPLSAVFKAFAALWTDGVMKAPLADSTIALVIGLGISLTAGTILGIGMGLFRVVDVALGPYVKAGLSAPLIAFVPVFLMLFGIGSTTRIATVVAFSVWIIAINTATAVRSAESALIEMGKAFGAGRWRLFWEIQLPAGAPSHGAPLRLVTPWKYGFKSIKSIVSIEFVSERPATFWNTLVPREYDFQANVNPEIPHPRWSQATERMIGTNERRPTVYLNGYEKWAAALYA